MYIVDTIEKVFEGHPAKIKLVKHMFIHGLGITEHGEIRCGEIKIPYNNVAKALDVSRITVSQTVKMILQNSELQGIFMNLEPTFSLASGKSLRYKTLIMSLKTGDARRISKLISKLTEDNTNIVKLLIYPSSYRSLNIEVVLRDHLGDTLRNNP